MFDRALIVGLGLLGGSFALALRASGLASHVLGTDANPGHAREALALGLVPDLWDRQATPIPFDLVFLAVPPGQVAAALDGLAPWLHLRTLVMDACSVKAPVAEALRAALGEHGGLLPAHPIAGWHTSGPGSARRDLFAGRPVILSPLPCTAPATRADATALWTAFGARIVELEARAHDALFALISHLPHLLAYTTVNLAVDQGADLGLAGPGFRDATRLAHCPAPLWADICLANQEALLPVMEAFLHEWQGLTDAIRVGDRAFLTRRLAGAQRTRSDLG